MSRLTFHPGILAGLLLFPFALVTQAQTLTTPESAVTTGLVGVTSIQTARLNVLNLQPVIPGVAATLCPATLEFYDDTGALLKQLGVTNISPATAASLTFKVPVPSAAAGARTQIRAVVRTPLSFVFNPGASPAPRAVCSVMASLEIIDDLTGATHLLTTDLRAMPVFKLLPQATQPAEPRP